jgi:hypothetical protein
MMTHSDPHLTVRERAVRESTVEGEKVLQG